MKGILFKDFLSAKRILTIYLLMIICFSFGGAKGWVLTSAAGLTDTLPCCR